jgi:hypothetical protein
MGVRHVPELSFLADRSGRFQARIEELMSRSRKSAAGKSVTASAPSPAGTHKPPARQEQEAGHK